MTLRSAGFVTDPITGPRSFGSAAPQRIGRRATPPLGSGCEVRRIWVERFGGFIGKGLYGRIEKASSGACTGTPARLGRSRASGIGLLFFPALAKQREQ